MLIKDFINSLDAHISIDYNLRRALINEFIPEGIGEILDYLNLDIKEYTKTVIDSDFFKLPLDFGYILKLSIGDIEYERVPYEKLNSELQYSIVYSNYLKLRYNYPLYINDILYSSFDILRSSELEGYRCDFINIDTGDVIGYLFDNENIYYSNNLTYDNNFRLMLRFSFNDDIIRFRNNDILKIKTNDLLLNIKLREGVNEYYIAEDGSLYSDQDLNNLILRGNEYIYGYYIKFLSKINEKVTILYKMSRPFYISENENEPLIDQYFDLLRNYCLKEIYLKMNKPIKMNEYKQEYKEKLMLMVSKKGKRQEFKIQRYVIPSTKLYRSKVTR